MVIDESEVEEDEMMKYQQQEFERLSRDPVMCLSRLICHLDYIHSIL